MSPYRQHPLVSEWLAKFLAVTPETPIEELLRVSRELWSIYQRADREVPGAIMAALDKITPKSVPRRAPRGSGKAGYRPD